MTEVLEPVLIRTAWVCGQKFSHSIIIAFYGNTSYGVSMVYKIKINNVQSKDEWVKREIFKME